MVVDVFNENVSGAKMEGRERAEGEKDENVILEFRPRVRRICSPLRPLLTNRNPRLQQRAAIDASSR
jgi:hypothetical protein